MALCDVWMKVSASKHGWDATYFKEFTNNKDFGWLNAISSLKDAAKSVGIEEKDFDKRRRIDEQYEALEEAEKALAKYGSK